MGQNPMCLKNTFLKPLSPNATGFFHPQLIVHYVQDLSKMQPACNSNLLTQRPGSHWESLHRSQLSLDQEQLVRDDSSKKENGFGVKCILKKYRWERDKKIERKEKRKNSWKKKKKQLKFALQKFSSVCTCVCVCVCVCMSAVNYFKAQRIKADQVLAYSERRIHSLHCLGAGQVLAWTKEGVRINLSCS